MNKVRKILLNILVTLLIYFLIYYLSHTLFHDYLFVWTAQNKYCYIWVLSFFSHSDAETSHQLLHNLGKCFRDFHRAIPGRSSPGSKHEQNNAIFNSGRTVASFPALWGADMDHRHSSRICHWSNLHEKTQTLEDA